MEGATTVIVVEGNQSPEGVYEMQEGDIPMTRDEKALADLQAAIEDMPDVPEDEMT